MDETWLRSTLFLLLMMIMKMQSSSGQPSIGLQGNVQNVMNVPILRLQLGVDFFVAIQTFLQQKATSQHFQQERVSSATSQDISPDSVHINSDSTHQGKNQASQFLFNQTTAQTGFRGVSPKVHWSEVPLVRRFVSPKVCQSEGSFVLMSTTHTFELCYFWF